MRRALRRTSFRWRCARSTLHKRNLRKAEKLSAVQEVIVPNVICFEVFVFGKSDVELCPRVGSTWSRVGKKTTAVTTPENRKQYVADSLRAHVGRADWVEPENKVTARFIRLLNALRRIYQRATHRAGCQRLQQSHYGVVGAKLGVSRPTAVRLVFLCQRHRSLEERNATPRH